MSESLKAALSADAGRMWFIEHASVVVMKMYGKRMLSGMEDVEDDESSKQSVLLPWVV